MSLFCYKCGNKLPDDARFCSTCGTATIIDNIRHEEESESQSYNMEIKKPLEELTVDEYIEVIEREILLNIADWLEQGKIKQAELPHAVTIYSGFLSSHESYEKDKANKNSAEYLMSPAENKAEVLSRLEIVATYLPIAKEVYEKHKNDKFREEETPLGHFDNQVALLEAMAKKGGITMMTKLLVQDLYENIFQHISESAIQKSPKLTRQQKVLTLYLETETIISTLRERWQNEHTKRKSSLFGKSQKLVVSDYKITAEKDIWGLITHAGITYVNTLVFDILEYAYLQAYLKWKILEELFLALLRDGEDPQADHKTYALMKQNVSSRASFVDSVLEVAKRRL